MGLISLGEQPRLRETPSDRLSTRNRDGDRLQVVLITGL